MLGKYINVIKRFITSSDWRFRYLSILGVYKGWSDEKFIKREYKAYVGENLNLHNPKYFGEKIQWLKLNDRRPEYTNMVDKYKVREYIAAKIGKQYLIPLVGGPWYDVEEIEWETLPNQFVLKPNHTSGNVYICKDKKSVNKHEIYNLAKSWLKRDYFYEAHREWPYKNVKRCIIAEAYIQDSESKELRDYKFYCFSGTPKYCQVISNRNEKETIDFYDMNWRHQEFTGLGLPIKPFSNTKIYRPKNFEKMQEIARELSKNIPFVRIDFYETDGVLYFGEITLYPASGLGKFVPDVWNRKLGDMIHITID